MVLVSHMLVGLTTHRSDLKKMPKKHSTQIWDSDVHQIDAWGSCAVEARPCCLQSEVRQTEREIQQCVCQPTNIMLLHIRLTFGVKT